MGLANWAVYEIKVTVFCDCGYVLNLVEDDVEVICPFCGIEYRPTVHMRVSRNEIGDDDET